jgi:hypothetical protein
MKSTDEKAIHELMLSCRRALTVFRRVRGDCIELETVRREVVYHMSRVLDELGLSDVAVPVRDQLEQFDGRHLED